jgi:hypothetical protein
VEPLILSLPGQPEPELVEHGGAFGNVLHVLQQRHAALAEFRRLLTNVAGDVQARSAADLHRLRELLSYFHALVYHFRDPNAEELDYVGIPGKK